MSTLLYIKASPRGDRSHSLAVADAFAESYNMPNPSSQAAQSEGHCPMALSLQRRP